MFKLDIVTLAHQPSIFIVPKRMLPHFIKMMELHHDVKFIANPELETWPDIPDLRVEPCFPKKWKERDIIHGNRTNRSPGSMLGKKKWWDK